MIITLLLVAIASACCAALEVLERHFFESIFKKLPQAFWYPGQSWKVAKQIFGYRIDAWHLFKSAMVVLLCIAIVSNNSNVSWWLQLIIYGTAWNITFGLFYHKWLRS